MGIKTYVQIWKLKVVYNKNIKSIKRQLVKDRQKFKYTARFMFPISIISRGCHLKYRLMYRLSVDNITFLFNMIHMGKDTRRQILN